MKALLTANISTVQTIQALFYLISYATYNMYRAIPSLLLVSAWLFKNAIRSYLNLIYMNSK